MKLGGAILMLIALVSCNRSRSENVKWLGDSGVLGATVQTYYQVTGQIPTNEEGFEALAKRPASLPSERPWKLLVDHAYSDAWDNPYHYKVIRSENPPEFEIRSFGPDGVRSNDDLVATFTVEIKTGSPR